MKNRKVADAMGVILKECNILGRTNVGETIGEVLSNEHRTIQQTFMREFVKAMKVYAETAGSDGRNEHAMEFAKGIADSNNYMPLI